MIFKKQNKINKYDIGVFYPSDTLILYDYTFTEEEINEGIKQKITIPKKVAKQFLKYSNDSKKHKFKDTILTNEELIVFKNFVHEHYNEKYVREIFDTKTKLVIEESLGDVLFSFTREDLIKYVILGIGMLIISVLFIN